jgi:hypothetical protein
LSPQEKAAEIKRLEGLYHPSHQDINKLLFLEGRNSGQESTLDRLQSSVESATRLTSVAWTASPEPRKKTRRK